jgi:hypothetical protein
MTNLGPRDSGRVSDNHHRPQRFDRALHASFTSRRSAASAAARSQDATTSANGPKASATSKPSSPVITKRLRCVALQGVTSPADAPPRGPGTAPEILCCTVRRYSTWCGTAIMAGRMDRDIPGAIRRHEPDKAYKDQRVHQLVVKGSRVRILSASAPGAAVI